MAQAIDLRSDTVTRPSAAMRKAMAEAEVGDDVLDGDPTTRRLEERVAELLGKGDALFFPSGTQANQTGIWLNTRPGTELLLEANAHADDHANAKKLTAGLRGHPAVKPLEPETNIVMLDLVREQDTADTVIPKLADRGVKVVPFGPKRLRAVTHLDVSAPDIDRAIGIIDAVLR